MSTGRDETRTSVTSSFEDATRDAAPPAPAQERGPEPVSESGADRLRRVWTGLIAEMPPANKAFLAATRPITLHGSTGIVAVPDDFTKTRLDGRLRSLLEDGLVERMGFPVRLAFTVDPELAPPVDPADLARAAEAARIEEDAPVEADPGSGSMSRSLDLSTHRDAVMSTSRHEAPPVQRREPGSSRPPRSVLESRLNPKYLFENFVIGSSNRFAHAAAVAAAEAPGKAYNPLLIYGDSGLGKTHLLHAIGHYVRSLFADASVRYVSSEEFTNEFINAIRDDKAPVFQRRYRDVDVLLIDDIQFLEGKIQTQEEFFHTFNTLHNANKQIVITSDRPPKRLEALEDRLRNRFEWGLITDVQPPDLETRIAILRKKAAIERLTAPPEVLEFIASKIQTNIRELEGALIRVTAFASLNQQPVDLTLTEIVLKDLIPEGGEPEITASLIIAQTASYFGLSIEEVCGPKRTRNLVAARQIGMFLCRELTPLSLPQIGREFGDRDHTTVMYANKRINAEMSERRSTYNQVTELTNRIKQQARQR